MVSLGNSVTFVVTLLIASVGMKWVAVITERYIIGSRCQTCGLDLYATLPQRNWLLKKVRLL